MILYLKPVLGVFSWHGPFHSMGIKKTRTDLLEMGARKILSCIIWYVLAEWKQFHFKNFSQKICFRWSPNIPSPLLLVSEFWEPTPAHTNKNFSANLPFSLNDFPKIPLNYHLLDIETHSKPPAVPHIRTKDLKPPKPLRYKTNLLESSECRAPVVSRNCCRSLLPLVVAVIAVIPSLECH